MRKCLTIILGISMLLSLCGCVAEISPDGYYGHRGYYHEYPRYRHDYDYPYGGGGYYRFRAR